MNSGWSIWNKVPGLIEALCQAIADKLTARQAAEKLSGLAGTTLSRNAMIGAAKRRGMRFGGGTPLPRKKTVRQEPVNIIRPKIVYEQPPEAPVPADFLGLTILDLPLNGCRYPSGDGPYLFCGNPQRDGSSYCAYHHKKCNYMPERKDGGNQWFALRDLKARTTPIPSKPPTTP